MATLADKGTYVRLEVNIWLDKRSDTIHLTSNDSDLPVGGMHMSAKKGTQSDRNLRQMLAEMTREPDASVCPHCGK